MSEFKFPTEVIELPSKGLVYPKDNPLSSGKVEIKYMTAKEEDILSNQSYIQKGVVLDKLLESVMIDSSPKDLIVGDKNAILVATRILGYGKDYKITVNSESHVLDLTTLENKEFDGSLIEENKNEFKYKLPNTGTEITFKILDGHDEYKINKELEGLKKVSKNPPELSTRLKHMITSVNGDAESKTIRDFVENYLLAMDSRSLRSYIREVQPDLNLVTTLDNGEEVRVPLGLDFFWPEYSGGAII
tara:strand:+ start:868 stop:1605 length:738 start_codon:yes stop_codon:yes gene_type:complete